MGVWRLFWRATKYRFKHPQKQPVPFVYLKPQGHSDTLIIVVPGLGGTISAYKDFILKPLAQHYHVYMSEMYHYGYTTKKKCMEFFLQRYNEAIKAYPAKKIVIVAHSMGNALSATAIVKHGIRCDAMYCLAPTPRPGDLFCVDENPDKKCLGYYVGPWMRWFCFAPVSFCFLQNIDIPLRIAIASNDEVTGMHILLRRKRFMHAFMRFKHVDIRVFEKRNHAFKFKQWSLRPVNKDNSKELLDDIVRFIQ